MNRIFTSALAAMAVFSAMAERTFTHPGLSYSREEIEEMRRQIAAKAEPAYSTFEALKNSGYSSLTSGEPAPVYAIGEGKHNATIGNDGRRAHDLALLYALTGDTRYADSALGYVNRYNTLTNSSARGTAPLDNGKIYLMLEAAELLRDYDGWSTADREQFCDMLVHPGYSDSGFPEAHYSLDDSRNDITFYWNIYNFDRSRWGNQGLFAARGLMAMGIFLDNEKIYERALRYVQGYESRTDDIPYSMGYTRRGRLNSETEYMADYSMSWIPGDREFISDEAIPYYIYANGQCQEACRDQGHVMAGLGQLVDIAEMAWHQGDDLYGAYDSRILLGLEWALRYNLSAIQGAPWEPSGYADYESRCSFDNGYFYRADSRSQRWHAKKPYDGDRLTSLSNVRYLRQALYHYMLRTPLPAERYEWLKKAVDYSDRHDGRVENWGASGHHYEWKGWGSLTRPMVPVTDGAGSAIADGEREQPPMYYDLQGRPAGTCPTDSGFYITSDGRKTIIRR